VAANNSGSIPAPAPVCAGECDSTWQIKMRDTGNPVPPERQRDPLDPPPPTQPTTESGFRSNFTDLKDYTKYANDLPAEQRKQFWNETVSLQNSLQTKTRNEQASKDLNLPAPAENQKNLRPAGSGSGFER
jgi:hypothetical protein